MTATIASAQVSNLVFVYDRGVRNVEGLTYNREANAYESVTRGEYYAKAEIAFLGREADGTWSLLTMEGKRFVTNLPNRGSAKVAAKRHFGSVMFS